jgi:hypothetical protein
MCRILIFMNSRRQLLSLPESVVGLRHAVSQLVQFILPDVSPAPFVLKKEIGPGNFSQEDIEIFVVNLDSTDGIQVGPPFRRALGQERPVPGLYEQIPQLGRGHALLDAEKQDFFPQPLLQAAFVGSDMLPRPLSRNLVDIPMFICICGNGDAGCR